MNKHDVKTVIKSVNRTISTWGAASSLLAAAMAAAFFAVGRAHAATATWLLASGDDEMDNPDCWQDGYIPQAGDTIDCSKMTGKGGIHITSSADVRFATVTNFKYMVMCNDAGSANWHFDHVVFNEMSTEGGVKENSAVDIDGRMTIRQNNGVGWLRGNCTIRADEIVKDASNSDVFLCYNAGAKSVFKTRQFTIADTSTKYFAISARNSGSLDIEVGAGGFSFCDSGVKGFYAVTKGTVTIYPAADYSFAENGNAQGAAIMLYDSANLRIGTTDCNDGTTKRTVTFVNGVSKRKSTATGTLEIFGGGVVDFNTCEETTSNNPLMPATKVTDTATLLWRDTATMGSGDMTFNPGTTFKAVQTSSAGKVAPEGTVTMADGSIIEAVLAEGSVVAPLQPVKTLALPDQGTVSVKVSGCDTPKKYALVTNLPAGTDVAKFALAQSPFPNAKLYVEDDTLKVGPGPGLCIIVR